MPFSSEQRRDRNGARCLVNAAPTPAPVPISKIIDASGVDYRLTGSDTLIEGSWDELLDLMKSCHAEMRKKTERVVTFLKIHDYGDRTRRLAGAVASVENKVGKALTK